MNDNNKITVLGHTFNTEEERREYFRNELRKKLPELKKMEGFPIGEDEDIIALSDPPYYTACPNPWLNDFIAEWEEEKKQLEKEGNREADFEVDEPYAADVSEGKNNPIYNAHSYHTKVPHPAIMRYILHYTQPGDIVFDGFAGTGMTGVAASMCGNPDPELKLKIENEFKRVHLSTPIWGERKTILNDLSPIAGFIASNYALNIDTSEFYQTAKDLLNEILIEHGWMYMTYHSNKQTKCLVNYTVWSEIHTCENCGKEFVFTDVFMDESKKKYKKKPLCPNCGIELLKKTSKVAYESIYDDQINKIIKIPKRVPILINYTYENKKYDKLPDSYDLNILKEISSIKINFRFPINKLPEMQMIKVGRMKTVNITYLHHFFLKRQLILISALWEKAKYIEDTRLRNATLFFIEQSIWGMSLLNRYSPTHFSQVNRALSGVFYVAAHISEVSPWYILNGKLKRLIKAFIALESTGNKTLISVGANQTLPLNDSSIDYIFTDPPFGENIYYSDLNILLESWHKIKTNNVSEAIVDRVKLKTAFTYQKLILKCFEDNYRVLKPGKWMTVEFSNTSSEIWNGIRTSLQNAGFIISNISALDKIQGTFQAVTSNTAVKQDLIISCYKPSSEFDNKFRQHQQSDIAVWNFVEEHLKHLPIHLVQNNATTAIIERSPKILYDRLVAFYVQKGLPVPLDAGKFQQGLRERFVERDGMFFTQEQAAQYDKKKAENPEFVQFSLLVSSEQDGILWLKSLLSKKPLTYQDIQPEWMQALAGVRKGDVLPELMQILEENFLKDEQGRWYVPDPENETDLEKLRNKRLLRQFEQYKEQAFKPKGKIKEARVEALRTGFKHCYQEKDFKTIVRVAERIPNNLLMEDEVLLQFYDIAVSRV